MVNLVDSLVQRTPVQSTVQPVVPGIFDDKEDGDLVGHLVERGERDGGLQPEVLCERMEEPGKSVSTHQLDN